MSVLASRVERGVLLRVTFGVYRQKRIQTLPTSPLRQRTASKQSNSELMRLTRLSNILAPSTPYELLAAEMPGRYDGTLREASIPPKCLFSTTFLRAISVLGTQITG